VTVTMATPVFNELPRQRTHRKQHLTSSAKKFLCWGGDVTHYRTFLHFTVEHFAPFRDSEVSDLFA